MTFKTLTTALATAAALIAPAVASTSASAATSAACTNPSVQVAATPTVSVVGTPVNYNYSFCYNTNGSDYTVQILSESPAASGSGYVSSAASPLATTALAAQPGTVSGSGVFTPTAAGRYEVVVAYYMQGQAAWEDEGQTVFIASTPAPTPVVTPPAPTPVVIPAVVPATPAPLAPVGTPAPLAALSLTKTANIKVAKAGGLVRYTLTVGNTSSTTADAVRVCDALPKNTLYVGASRTASFDGADACFAIGNLSAGTKAVTTLTLRLAKTASGHIINHATASASNAASVTAQATVIVKAKPILVIAPVTG
jgi:uncharacterized repeat protein (TIGR01451 family)